MARLTSQLAAQKIGNLYQLVLIGAYRARELNQGEQPQVKCKNGSVITALREIEQGHVGKDYLLKPQILERKRTRR